MDIQWLQAVKNCLPYRLKNLFLWYHEYHELFWQQMWSIVIHCSSILSFVLNYIKYNKDCINSQYIENNTYSLSYHSMYHPETPTSARGPKARAMILVTYRLWYGKGVSINIFVTYLVIILKKSTWTKWFKLSFESNQIYCPKKLANICSYKLHLKMWAVTKCFIYRL